MQTRLLTSRNPQSPSGKANRAIPRARSPRLGSTRLIRNFPTRSNKKETGLPRLLRIFTIPPRAKSGSPLELSRLKAASIFHDHAAMVIHNPASVKGIHTLVMLKSPEMIEVQAALHCCCMPTGHLNWNPPCRTGALRLAGSAGARHYLSRRKASIHRPPHRTPGHIRPGRHLVHPRLVPPPPSPPHLCPAPHHRRQAIPEREWFAGQRHTWNDDGTFTMHFLQTSKPPSSSAGSSTTLKNSRCCSQNFC